MKKTINVSIGAVPFTMDMDAYEMIRTYLDQIRARVEDGEVMEDVEARIAEIFSERLSEARQVVDGELASQAIAIIGRAETFGELRYSPPPPLRDKQPGRRKLYRSRGDRVIGGVCGGVAEFLDVDPLAVRLATVLGVLFGGISLWVYIIMWIVIPEDRA